MEGWNARGENKCKNTKKDKLCVNLWPPATERLRSAVFHLEPCQTVKARICRHVLPSLFSNLRAYASPTMRALKCNRIIHLSKGSNHKSGSVILFSAGKKKKTTAAGCRSSYRTRERFPVVTIFCPRMLNGLNCRSGKTMIYLLWPENAPLKPPPVISGCSQTLHMDKKLKGEQLRRNLHEVFLRSSCNLAPCP